MIVQTMGRMMELMAPATVNGLQPERPSRTDGLARSVYDQMRDEFFVAGPFVIHGEIPPLLAGAWSIVRETLFTGDAPRGEKEIIAWAVSQGNQCPFCIDAHGAAKTAAEAEDSVLERWARSSASAEEVADAPHPDGLAAHAAEFLGTLTAFHYLNRMVSVFLDEKMMPLPDALDGVTESMARFMMGGMIDRATTLDPGHSLGLLADHDSKLAWLPTWADGSPTLAGALAGWSANIETEARARFDEGMLNRLGERFDRWRGGIDLTDPDEVPALGDPPTEAVAMSRLATLTVEAPYRVTRREVDEAIAAGSSADALAIVAWASYRAARRCAEWTAAAAGMG